MKGDAARSILRQQLDMTLAKLTTCPYLPGWQTIARPSANDWRIMKAQE